MPPPCRVLPPRRAGLQIRRICQRCRVEVSFEEHTAGGFACSAGSARSTRGLRETSIYFAQQKENK